MIVKLFMSRVSFLFGVLKSVYEHQSFDILHLFESSSVFSTANPMNILYTVLPQTSNFHFSPLSSSIEVNAVSSNGVIRDNLLRSLEPKARERFLTDAQVMFSMLFDSLYITVTSHSFVTYRSLSTSLLTETAFITPSILISELSYLTVSLRSIFTKFIHSDFNVSNAVDSHGSDYSVNTLSYSSAGETVRYSLTEDGQDSRFMRNMNPIFKYDFKVGNYMTDEMKKMNPHLFMTIKDITTGLRKSS